VEPVKLAEKIDQMVARIRAIKSLQDEVSDLERQIGEALGKGDFTHRGNILLRVTTKAYRGVEPSQWRVEVIEAKRI
jgi:hypothetical protein